MNINEVVDINDARECVSVGYNRLLDELEFIQKVCELHGMPSDIAERMTEKVFGIVSDCRSDVDNFINKVEGYAKYIDQHSDNIGGITRVDK